MSLENLTSQGYENIETTITKSDLDVVMDGFRDFIELPDEIKETTNFYQTDRGDGDFGFFRRTPGSAIDRGKATDNKDIFHFGAATRQVVEARNCGALPKAMRSFLDDAESLFWQAQATKRSALGKICLGAIIDKQNGDVLSIADAMTSPTQPNNDVMRLIHYYDSDSVLAKAHCDRSVATLALGESHPGLRVGPCLPETPLDVRESRLEPVAYREKIAKFFLGAGWQQLNHIPYLHADKIPMAWHDVVQTDEVVDDYVRRWAAILFCNPHLGITDYQVPSRSLTRPNVTNE